jgi:serine-threonine kinase receptor-associated protein
MLREGDTGDWIGTFEGHKGAVWGATLNRDATRAATGAADFSAKLWEAMTGTELHSFSHKHIVKSVDFSNDSSKLVTGCNDKTLRVFDLQNYASDPILLTGHTSNIKRCLFLEESRKVVSIADDKTLRVWDTNSGDQHGREVFNLKLTNTPTSIEMSRDNQMFIVSHGNQVEMYDAGTLSKINAFTIPNPVSACCIHPNKSVFVCAGENFTLYKYSIETGTELGNLYIHY